ncbi:MAG: hypothetical protein ACI3XP_01150 [Eubacteriales bacterium]
MICHKKSGNNRVRCHSGGGRFSFCGTSGPAFQEMRRHWGRSDVPNKTSPLRVEAEKVYEAIHYSDPVSDTFLADVDSQIKRQSNAFVEAIKAEDGELAKATADALIEVVERRNQKCKLLK